MGNTKENSYDFGKLRAFFWPIYSHEIKKILSMFTLFFLISFVYHILRCLKIAIVVKAPGSGAEIIPFLKVWCVLPAAFIFSYIYSYLGKHYDRVTIFNKYLSIFIIFFVAFTFLLFPQRNSLECNLLLNVLPSGLRGFGLLFKFWPLALFYVFAEMWSIMVLTVLFWGFSNEITKVSQAKRFYAFIALGANCAAIFSGQAVQLMSLKKTISWLPYSLNLNEQVIFLFMLVTIICCLAIMQLFAWINKQSFADIKEQTIAEKKQANKDDNIKKTWKQKLSFLTKTPELGYLTIIVLTYNVIANLSDIIWTYQLDLRLSDSSAMVETLGRLDMMIGFTTVFFALFGFSNVIRKFGWKIAAITTPCIWTITCCLVFAGLFLENLSDGLFILTQIPIHEFIINIFMLQMCLGKASKYTFFDQSKEIAFIPLSPAQQRKGKALIDGITSRFGKSGSSVYFQILLISCSGEIAATIPYAALIIIVMLSIWFIATLKLSSTLNKKIYTEEIKTSHETSNNYTPSKVIENPS